jgi:hypothetical protein
MSGFASRTSHFFVDGMEKAPLTKSAFYFSGGDEEGRTPDLCIANAALCQLSYIPERRKFKVPGSKFQVDQAKLETWSLELEIALLNAGR